MADARAGDEHLRRRRGDADRLAEAVQRAVLDQDPGRRDDADAVAGSADRAQGEAADTHRLLHVRRERLLDRRTFAPVPGQVALTVSVQVQPTDPTAATHRILPDPGVHCATLPLDVARKADVHR